MHDVTNAHQDGRGMRHGGQGDQPQTVEQARLAELALDLMQPAPPRQHQATRQRPDLAVERSYAGGQAKGG